MLRFNKAQDGVEDGSGDDKSSTELGLSDGSRHRLTLHRKRSSEYRHFKGTTLTARASPNSAPQAESRGRRARAD